MRKSVCKFMDYLCRGKGRREKMDKCRTREVKRFASEGEDERMSGVFDFSLPLQFFCSHLILSSLQFHYPALFLNATLPLSLPVCLPFLPSSALRAYHHQCRIPFQYHYSIRPLTSSQVLNVPFGHSVVKIQLLWSQ